MAPRAGSIRPASEPQLPRADNKPQAHSKPDSNSPPFWWTAAIVRNRSYVPNKANFDPRRLNSSHSRLAAGPRTLHPHLAGIHPKLAGLLSGANAGLLRSEWSALA